jgi:hypothetical protein
LFNAKRSITKLRVQLAHPERAKSQKSEKSQANKNKNKKSSSLMVVVVLLFSPMKTNQTEFTRINLRQSVSQEWMMDGRGLRSILIAHPSFSFSFHLLSRFKLGYKGEKMEEMPL